MIIKILKAEEGDCFLVKINDEAYTYNILIDGGTSDTYSENGLKEEVLNILKKDNEYIDLMILTHIHDDHIGGIIALYEDREINKEELNKKIKEIWFNSSKVIAEYCKTSQENIKGRDIKLQPNTNDNTISKSQGYTLEKAINRELRIIKSSDIYEMGNIKFTILSPNDERLKILNEAWPCSGTQISSNTGNKNRSIKDMIENDKNHPKDNNPFNGSSISFILECKEDEVIKRCLFLGDSFFSVNLESLEELGYSKQNKLKVDLVKLSHHGSIYNFNEQLLEFIECKKFVISTDYSSNQYAIKRGIARLLKWSNNDIELLFNYNNMYDIFSNEFEQYKGNCRYVDGEVEV
ncbi:MBL fold metallo-hydrolase [Clostridium butyricum]|uniref:MBL fold metallo-hydrolase n=1 Tax=Clostridium butyricum TaxID=1492 RepID=UPI0018A89DEA|nr:MBL fold metallo-hydrolase [Clostridium butyricum]MDB2155846.1 MBL fold metallo-hydrolase [Clostridium butyricum]